jgi:L-ascorbate metabolism protein UlaG (beta-lactamase superfamily)
MWSYRGIRVHWLGHDSFALEGSRTVVIDPFKVKGGYRADVLLVTHEHYDHLSVDDIKKVTSKSTRVVAAQLCEEELSKLHMQVTYVSPGSHAEVSGVKIDAVPAYNVNKFRAPGQVFHPKQDGRVGYVLELDGVTFYHAGDTDAIPEMKSIVADVALLPVSGTYVMTAEEAASAVSGMKVKVAIPMHFASIVGSKADAAKFKSLAKTEVVILESE